MKQEDKELFLKDLCARIPYFPEISINNKKGVLLGVDYNILLGYEPTVIVGFDGDAKGVYTSIFDAKPYLRPMTSVTKEEKLECEKYNFYDMGDGDFANDKGEDSYSLIWLGAGGDKYDVDKFIDYLISRHLDFRGLIEKGLALEAQEGMYKFE